MLIVSQSNTFSQGHNQLRFSREGQNDYNMLFYLTLAKGFWKFWGRQLPGCPPGCGPDLSYACLCTFTY